MVGYEQRRFPLVKQILVFIVKIPIRVYQWVISPLTPGTCRHEPTCSNYMLQAIDEWGAIKGTWLGLKRLGRCHPWGTSGYDPVPKKNE
jgi:uncharacterized protein